MNKEEIIIYDYTIRIGDKVIYSVDEDIIKLIKELQKKVELGETYKKLYDEIKKQKEDVIEYIKEHIKYECDDVFNGMQFYSYHLYDFNKENLLRMLGEIDVED